MKDFDIAKYLREHQLGSYGILNHYVDLKPLNEDEGWVPFYRIHHRDLDKLEAALDRKGVTHKSELDPKSPLFHLVSVKAADEEKAKSIFSDGKGIHGESVDRYGDRGASNFLVKAKKGSPEYKNYTKKLSAAGIIPQITDDGSFYVDDVAAAKKALGIVSETTDIPYKGHDHLDGQGGSFTQDSAIPEVRDFSENKLGAASESQFYDMIWELAGNPIKSAIDTLRGHGFEDEDIKNAFITAVDLYDQVFQSDESVEIGENFNAFDPTDVTRGYKKFLGDKPASIQAQSPVDKVMNALKKANISKEDIAEFIKVVTARVSAPVKAKADVVAPVKTDVLPLEEVDDQDDISAGKFKELKDLLSRYDFYYERRHGKKAPGHYEIITSIKDLMNNGVSEDEIKKAAMDSIKQAKEREVSEDELRHIGYFIDNAKNLTPDAIQRLKNLF